MFKSNTLNSLFSIIVLVATIGYVAYCLYNAIDIIGSADVIGAGVVRLAFFNRVTHDFTDVVTIHSKDDGGYVATTTDGLAWSWNHECAQFLFDGLQRRYGSHVTDARVAIHDMAGVAWLAQFNQSNATIPLMGFVHAAHMIPSIEEELRAQRAHSAMQKGWVYNVDAMDVVEGHSARELEMLGLSIRSVQADSYDTEEDLWT